MKTNSVVEIKDLNLKIDGMQILKNINLSIPRNKLTVIIGPSGCGKTTLLKTINRLIDLTDNVKIEGKVFIDDEDIFSSNDITRVRRKAGLLSQRPYPLPMSIYNNIAFGLKMGGRSNPKIIKMRVEHYLKQVNLWEEVKDRLSTSAFKLSGGQQQRLCIARTLAVEPDVILFDEPCSGLDPISTAKVEDAMAELKKNYTLILVTNNVKQAARVGDRTAFFLSGDLIEIDKTEKIFTAPANKKTDDYIRGIFG